MDEGAEKRLAELVARQGNVAASRQLVGLGVSHGIVRRKVRRGAWRWVHRGVVALTSSALTDFERELAAVLAAGPGAVLSHLSAARRHRLEVPRDMRVHVTIPASRSVLPLEGVELWRSRDLRPEDVVTVGATPMTRLGRTVVDLSSLLDPGWLRSAVDSALRRRPCNRKWLVFALEQHGAGRPGARRLRGLLDAHHAGKPLSESTLESRAMELGLATGRKPHRQLWIRDGAGFQVRVDFAWPEVRLCIETDGYETHASREAFGSDRARDRRLFALGWTVLRFTWADVDRFPQGFIDEVARAHAPLTGRTRRAAVRP